MSSAIEQQPRERNRARSGGQSQASASSAAQAAHTGANNSKNKGIVTAMIFALCIFNIFDVDIRLGKKNDADGRRSLLSLLYLSGPSTLMPWSEHHLVDVTDKPDPVAETALFWHIPKSGGTTAKRLYQCMGQTLAHRVGGDPRYGHDEESEIAVFEPHKGKDWKVVNVDTTIRPGIIRAKRLGLVQSHTSDLIFTMEPQFAGQELYDEENKGRFMALFRHPVDRALSMFFYLQSATWERTYRPEWANMTVLEWAKLPNAEEDYMVHKLVGKRFGDTIDEMDLIVAKELVRQRFIVGLMGEMNESIRRFNIVLGVDTENERSQQCMEEFGLVDAPPPAEDGERKLEGVKTHATDKKNSNKHPKFEEGSPEYEIVAGRNKLDMLLYKYIESLFESQKEIIDSFLQDEEPEENNSIATHRSNLALLPPGSEGGPVSSSSLDFRDQLANVGDPIGASGSETPFFWHVPKSGGTTLQRLYWCMGSTVANEVGVNPKFGKYKDEHSKLVAFSPWKDNPGKVVNVDMSTNKGILEAKERGFLSDEEQPHVDFVSTSEFQFTSMSIFTPQHKARMFALFRHPIDRAVSKFFYLQKATWEPTYNKRWAKMGLEKWASRDRGDNNWMVRHLIGKSPTEDLNNDDLELAKDIVSTKFVVGLMDQFEESVRRFNVVLGIDEGDPENRRCINEFSSNEGDSHKNRNKEKIVKKNQFNSYTHPEVKKGSPAWVSLAKIHMYDTLLHRHIVELFSQQESLFPRAASEGRAAKVDLM